MSYKKLIEKGLKSTTDVDTEADFQEEVENIPSGTSPSCFFDETSSIEISYISNTVILVKDVLEQIGI